MASVELQRDEQHAQNGSYHAASNVPDCLQHHCLHHTTAETQAPAPYTPANQLRQQSPARQRHFAVAQDLAARLHGIPSPNLHWVPSGLGCHTTYSSPGAAAACLAFFNAARVSRVSRVSVSGEVWSPSMGLFLLTPGCRFALPVLGLGSKASPGQMQ